MKSIAKSLYTEPVVFLALIQALATALATANVIPVWVSLVTLAAVTGLQRATASPSPKLKRKAK